MAKWLKRDHKVSASPQPRRAFRRHCVFFPRGVHEFVLGCFLLVVLVDNARASPIVGVFAQEKMNGSGVGDCNDKTLNIMTSLKYLTQTNEDFNDYVIDTSITTFATSNLASRLDKFNAFVMPEIGDLSKVGGWGAKAQDVMRSYVEEGGVLVLVSPRQGGPDFLNSIFQENLVLPGSDIGRGRLCSPQEKVSITEYASGTPFQGGPSYLDCPESGFFDSGEHRCIPMYGTNENPAVGLLSFGGGLVILFAWDFDNAGRNIDIPLIGRHVDCGDKDNPWFTEIFPRVLQVTEIVAAKKKAKYATKKLDGYEIFEGVEIVCQDPPWYDSRGEQYDCEWYSRDDNCQKYGRSFSNYGSNAAGACCSCGAYQLVLIKDPNVFTSPPTSSPTAKPTPTPTRNPTRYPSKQPTPAPTFLPTVSPTSQPTSSSTQPPTLAPTRIPTLQPTVNPTPRPSAPPTVEPTIKPTHTPTLIPTNLPTLLSTSRLTNSPTSVPSPAPTTSPTGHPTTPETTGTPTLFPTNSSALHLRTNPTLSPTVRFKKPVIRASKLPPPASSQPSKNPRPKMPSRKKTGMVCSSKRDCISNTCRSGVCMASSECYPVKHKYGTPFDINKINLVFVGSAFNASTHEAWREQVKTTYRLMENYKMLGKDIDQLNIFRVDPTETSGSFCDFGCEGVDRLLCCDEDTTEMLASKCFSVGANMHAVVIHSSNTYGGAGYRHRNIATASTDPRSALILVHELGHSLFELNDEYSSGDGSDLDPNCAASSTCEKWSDLIDNTPAGYAKVDCVPGCQGGNYFVSGLSYMNVLGASVGAVHDRLACCTYLALTKSFPKDCEIFNVSPNYLYNYCKENDFQKYGAANYENNTKLQIMASSMPLANADDTKFVFVSDPVLVKVKLRRNGKAAIKEAPLNLPAGMYYKEQVQGDFRRLKDAAKQNIDSVLKVKVFYGSGTKSFFLSRISTIDVPMLPPEEGETADDGAPRRIFKKRKTVELILNGSEGTIRKVRASVVSTNKKIK